MKRVINIFQISATSRFPEKAHKEDACYDLYADLMSCDELKCLSNSLDLHGYLTLVESFIKVTHLKDSSVIEIPPMSSVIIPTGICMGIEPGYRVDVNARSGRAANSMQNLTNGVGIIDAGYKDQVKVIFHNMAAATATIYHHDKIAQFHEEPVLDTQLVKVSSIEELGHSQDRQGGLGSTGN